MRRVGAVFLAVAGLAALSACSGGNSTSAGTPPGTAVVGQYGSVPPEHGTVHTGTFKIAQPPNAAPTWILPLITASTNSVYTAYGFDYDLYRPLYWVFNGVHPMETPSMSLASDPVWANGDKTLTITMKSSYKWSDGWPLTSRDVLFWFDMLRAAVKESPANWAPYTPGLGLPDEVAGVSTPSASTIVFHLTKPVNPAWFWRNEIATLQPMPSHAWSRASANGSALDFTVPANAAKIYNFLAAQSKSVATYATNPLWQVVDGPYKLTSFKITTGAFTMTPNRSYGGPRYVPLADVPQVSSVKPNYYVFGYPAFSWSYITYNFKDTTGGFSNIIDKLYIRQALAHLENEAGYIKAYFYGAGGPAYGPLPAIPASPYTPANALTNPYPFSPSAAAALLKAHGWSVVPGGTDIFSQMIKNYNDPTQPQNAGKWAMEAFGGFINSAYPTTFGVFNSTGSSNVGGYSDPQADKLISASISSSGPKAVIAEASYLTAQQPSLFQPIPDSALAPGVIAISKTMSGDVASQQSLTQFQITPELWYFTR